MAMRELTHDIHDPLLVVRCVREDLFYAERAIEEGRKHDALTWITLLMRSLTFAIDDLQE